MKSSVPSMQAGHLCRCAGSVRRVMIALLLTGAVIASAPAQDAPADNARETPGPWALLTQYRFKEARLAFAKTPPGDASDERLNSLGRSLSRLVNPDFSKSDLPQIVAALEQLWNAHAQDQAGLWAGYYLGRIHQNHAEPGAPLDDALAWYLRTAAAAALENEVGQLARLKAEGLLLYAPLQNAGAMNERLDRAEALAGEITTPYLRLNSLLLLANGLLYRHAATDRVMTALQTAWDLGVTDPTARAQMLVQMGNLAAGNDQPELAGKYYQRFLNEFPTDIRAQLVRDHLNTLTGGHGDAP